MGTRSTCFIFFRLVLSILFVNGGTQIVDLSTNIKIRDNVERCDVKKSIKSTQDIIKYTSRQFRLILQRYKT